MLFTVRFGWCALAAVWLIAATGCVPSSQSSEDEEKEPHFVLGNSRFNDMDYSGAVEAFRSSLEVNPRSAQAHYRLAQLFDNERMQPDPAAAIFHYQEYLRLDPHAENIQIIQQRIAKCRSDLATSENTIPTAPATLRRMEELTETNRVLLRQIDELHASVKQWSDYATSLQAAAKLGSAAQNNFSLPPGGSSPDDLTAPPAGQRPPSSTAKPVPPKIPKARTYSIKSGETLASIARKQGVSLTALQAANPGVNPKKLRAGQTVKLP